MRTRREMLGLAGLGGVVLASSLTGCFGARGRRGAARAPTADGTADADDFYFLQLSDTHVGFEGAANPEAAHTLERAVGRIVSSGVKPAFIVFTGDLTHTTDDDDERRRRLARFRELIAPLGDQTIHYLPGEHDASLDEGAAFREAFGPSRWSFDHRGVHFVGVDNVSDPAGAIGADGLAWLRADLAPIDRDAPIVVFTHRPLFDLYPTWDWATKDGARAIEILSGHRHVTVFYGHIHQDHHDTTGTIAHHAARSLIFPLPAPGSVPEKKAVAWDPSHPFAGLGWRQVDEPSLARTELDLAGDGPRTIAITAKRFAFDPSTIELAVGVPVVLELRSLDRVHGLEIPGLGVDEAINPGEVTRVALTPRRTGRFPFHCDRFCGSGHEAMTGTVVVR